MKLTKVDILEIISNSTWKLDSTSPDKQALYDKYYPLLEAQLLYCSPKRDFKTVSNLEEIMYIRNRSKDHWKTKFDNYIRDTEPADIENKFESVLADIKADARYAIIPGQCVEYFHERQNKRHKWSVVAIASIILVSLVAVVLAVLEWCGILGQNEKPFGFIEFSGIFDLFVGVAFFVYEFFEDRNQKEVYDNVQKATTGITQNLSGVCFCGNGNQFGNYNNGENPNEIRNQAIENLKKLGVIAKETNDDE